jgi:type II secretory pathway component PulF
VSVRQEEEVAAAEPLAHPIELTAERSRRFRIASLVSAFISAWFVLGHVLIGVRTLPVFERMYSDLGGQLPATTQLLVALGQHGLLAVLLVVADIALFILMYRVAKRKHTWLLFLPIAGYVAISVALITVLYLPILTTVSRVVP